MSQPSASRRAPVRQDVVNWLHQPHPALTGNAWAAAHGAGDSLPFGVADRGSSAIRAALLGRRPGENFRSAYARYMAQENAQDLDEARRYGVARAAGMVAGTAGQIALLGPLEGAVAGGTRIGQATGMIAREHAALAGVGAALGAGSQAVSDVAHRKVSSPGDYAGAAVGGAVEGLTSMTGKGTYAASAGGAATSLAQDIANGRLPSLERASQAASQGAALGAAAGSVGRAASNRLSPRDKGKLGETLSLARTWARGQKTLPIKNKPLSPKRGSTVPDHWLAGERFVESKFGKGVKGLSPAQRRAFEQLNANPGDLYPAYRVDHWLPEDIGAALAALASPQAYLNRDGRRAPSAD